MVDLARFNDPQLDAAAKAINPHFCRFKGISET